MFFTKYIKIPNVKERFLQNRLQLLKDIVKSFVITFPFQNISSFGVPPPGPKPTPTVKQLLEAILQGKGSMCGHHNNSLATILSSIGYETYTVAAKFRRTQVEGSHFVCMVKMPALFSENGKDDVYLVDGGCGIPLFEPVSVNNLPYYGRAGGFNFKFEINKEGTIMNRIHENGCDAIGGSKAPNYLSPQDYTILMEPKTLVEVLPNFCKVYSEPNSSAFHTGFYVFRYLHIEADGSDFKIACVRGKELMFITKETRSVQKFDNFVDLQPIIQQYFPQIPTHEVIQAVKNFTQVESEKRLLQ